MNLTFGLIRIDIPIKLRLLSSKQFLVAKIIVFLFRDILGVRTKLHKLYGTYKNMYNYTYNRSYCTNIKKFMDHNYMYVCVRFNRNANLVTAKVGLSVVRLRKTSKDFDRGGLTGFDRSVSISCLTLYLRHRWKHPVIITDII